MTWEDLKTYVGSKSDSDAYVTACFEEATELVDAFIGSATVPQIIRNRCVLEVGARLFSRRDAKDGLAQYASLEGAPVFVARDPMVGVYPILNRYMVIGL